MGSAMMGKLLVLSKTGVIELTVFKSEDGDWALARSSHLISPWDPQIWI